MRRRRSPDEEHAIWRDFQAMGRNAPPRRKRIRGAAVGAAQTEIKAKAFDALTGADFSHMKKVIGYGPAPRAAALGRCDADALAMVANELGARSIGRARRPR